jgi:CheY-like chemotaxis protein
VVDDDGIAQKLLAKILEKMGYGYKLISNAAEALKFAALSNPNLILLDLMMPGFNGVDFVKQYSKLPKKYASPIIVISAIMRKDVIEPLLKMGVKDYLIKPIDIQSLTKKITANIQ